MKEYTYEAEHTWEKQRRPVVVDHQNHHHRPRHPHRHRHHVGDDAAMDADASSISETTSESGVSDLETSMTDFRCTCCPYGYHLDTDFMKFLDDMYGPDVLRTLKKIERKRHDVRRRLINEQQQPMHTIPVQPSSTTTSFDNEILRETLLELDRIVEKDIKELEAECHRHAGHRTQSHTAHTQQQHQHRSRSVDSRRQHRPPPRPPTSSTAAAMSSSNTRTAEEHRLYERRMQMEKTITTRTLSAPRLNLMTDETMSSIRKLDTTTGGPITMLYKIPPPPFSRSSSSSSLSTETTLRVSSPEPDQGEPLKPLYITEVTVPPKPIVRVQQPLTTTTVVTITDKTEIERRNREIDRLEQERRTLLSEKELLLKEIDRYKHRPVTNVKIPEQVTTRDTSILTNREHIEQVHTHHMPPPRPPTREVAMQHIVEDEQQQPPPLPPKQRQQRDVAISHVTEYDDDDEKQTQIVRRKLEEIKNYYTERIHILEERILEQEKDIDRLSEPKKQRHVNTQCQPSMQDRALVTDSFRSVRDVALTCHLQPTLPGPVAHRDVSLQCNTHEFIQQRDVWMEAMADVPIMRDVSIGVSLNMTPDRHFRDVGTHVNFDYKPEVQQRDVAVMFAPEPIKSHDRASNTQPVQTREFGAFANTIEPPKPPPKPSMRPAATDTRNLISYKDTASGSNDFKRPRDMATDTFSLVSLHDRASGHDIPAELLSRTVSTDTRTLISTRDNFSTTIPIFHTPITVDAHTQSKLAVQNDASSNTAPAAENRHTGVQAVQEQPTVKHGTTSIDLDIFHQLGHFRHIHSNTDSKRSTDRSTITERRTLHDLAVNTEPKIMYSKDVGDFDVRIEDENRFVEHQEFTWNTLHGRRPSLHSTSDRSLMTDLQDTKREVGYIERPKRTEDTVEEQRQEIITFRVPQPRPLQTTTEETYETTITTETTQKNRLFEEMRSQIRSNEDSGMTIRKSEMTEWSRKLGGGCTIQPKSRSGSPEELVEESYEVISTLAKPTEFLITSSSPHQRQSDLMTTTTGKPPSSEDDSSYCEEWTVTESKRKQDGQTVQTVIDRGGHHRYSIDAESTGASSQLRHRSGEHISSTGIGATQIREHEETTQLSPTTVLTTSTYESRRILGAGQPVLGATSTGFRTYSPVISPRSYRGDDTTDEQQVEEKYEVTLSTYDESGLKLLTPGPMTTSATAEDFELDEEMYIACAIVNESLYDNNADKKKVQNCLQLIQQDWFRVSSQKNVNSRLIENYLNSFKEHFSNFLLERVVNMQDANGNTALHYCVTNGNWHVVKMLLDTKVCDICLQNNAGYTAVMMAAVIDVTSDEQRQIVSRLFRESGNVNVKTTGSNQTALMLAVKHGKADLVELLLENSAAVNLQDADGSTALMCAVEHQHVDIVKLLLTRPECDVNITDNEGQTAVSIATNKNRKDILVSLYAKIKERKGHHSALGSKPRSSTSSSIPSRIPAPDRSTSTSSRKSSTETASPSSRRRGSSGSGNGGDASGGGGGGGGGSSTGPTVSTFRRY